MSASAGASRARAPFTPRRVSRVAARPRMSPRAAPNASPPPSSAPAPTAVVVGGGWAGFGAAWQLVKHGFDVTLLDASPNPGGLSQGWRTANGRAVEAGCKGFWRHYKNIDALCAELRIDPFTPYTSSAFYGPKGRETEAPVFGDLPRLPAPLGTLLYTSPYFRNLSLEDRLSAAPLALDLLRYDADDDAYLRYDARSARDVFLDDAGSKPTGGASQALYDAFLAPVLCALMFARPEELSAAAALDVLYGYVLAHQDDFDVRWCRGTVAERIFQPWTRAIRNAGGSIRGGRRVSSITPGVLPDDSVDDSDSRRKPRARVRVVSEESSSGSTETTDADVVVMAAGVGATRAILSGSPELAAAPGFAGVSSIPSADVIAVRLFLDAPISMPNASNVWSGFSFRGGDGETLAATRDVAGTFFDLCALQDEYRESPGAVVEVDMYNAGSALGLADEELARAALDDVLRGCLGDRVPRDVVVEDFSVLRFAGGVTKFAPGTAKLLPRTTPEGLEDRGVFAAGDWTWQGPGSHGARGLSQEKALVSGFAAADAAARWIGMATRKRNGVGAPAKIRNVERDEDHVAAAKAMVRAADAAGANEFLSSLPKPPFPFPPTF